LSFHGFALAEDCDLKASAIAAGIINPLNIASQGGSSPETRTSFASAILELQLQPFCQKHFEHCLAELFARKVPKREMQYLPNGCTVWGLL
jgi:hypothetical protein